MALPENKCVMQAERGAETQLAVTRVLSGWPLKMAVPTWHGRFYSLNTKVRQGDPNTYVPVEKGQMGDILPG